jgi:hypothetical protein
MTVETADPLALAPHDALSMRAPMFGHVPIRWGQHAGAVFGAAFVSATVRVGVAMAVAWVLVHKTGGSLGPHPILVTAVGSLVLWIPFLLIVLAEYSIGFTIARAALMLARRNFGGAYLAIGLVIGMVEATMLTVVNGGTRPQEFVVAAAVGVLGGFVYWLIATREYRSAEGRLRAEAARVFR